jgi:L-2-hydroxyglutarate oxidase LhgO
MHALRRDAERYGAMVALETPILSGRVDDVGIIVETGGASPIRIAANAVVNAAGLGSHAFARSIIGMPADKIPPLHLAKGNYFALTTQSPFTRLIYPIPTPGGLGVHLTLDLAGQARFGPDVNGWKRSTTKSILFARTGSTPPSEPIGPTCRIIHCSPPFPGYDQKSPGLAGPKPSPSPNRSRSMECPA